MEHTHIHIDPEIQMSPVVHLVGDSDESIIKEVKEGLNDRKQNETVLLGH